jgi:hypothetical protein
MDKLKSGSIFDIREIYKEKHLLSFSYGRIIRKDTTPKQSNKTI